MPTAVSTLPRILLVDDNVDNLMLMQLYLGDAPYQVEVASNGREAVDKFAAAAYDLVFMDLEMPILDGYEASRAIRDMERRAGRPAVPILVLTAHALDEFRQRCDEAGCTDFLTKPVRKNAVLEAVARYLGDGGPPRRRPAAAPAPDGELELLRPLLPIFFATAAATLDGARQALDADDLETARRQGHKLKGSALSYGFEHLGQAALELERAGEDGDADKAAAALDRALALLAEARRGFAD
ncbi:response regulator [Solidesulfovibrio sp.]|uniref:response regulator n=1 Tax=Solidesulfovibrio sp. TaxID=2910990 RepID=UPI00261F825E|nr:response regulator [Solidesulfovibrio sp.]